MRRKYDAIMADTAYVPFGAVTVARTDYSLVIGSDACDPPARFPALAGASGESKAPQQVRPTASRRRDSEEPLPSPESPPANDTRPAPPCAGSNRGFQIDLDELADEFSDCGEYTDCNTGECRVKVLPTLYRIIRVVADTEDLAEALAIILAVMRERMRMVRGMVSLLDRRAGTIFIHESFGLTEEQQARGLYAPGEGIIGEVVASGKAIVAPRLRDNPQFLDRTQSHDTPGSLEVAFLCVPILAGGKVIGTISGERPYASNRLLKQDFELLATIASMIAPAVELYLVENIEQKDLENENRRLRAALGERFKPSNIIGASKPMLDVYELIGKIAPAKTTVLVLGESGVGKELVANAIHYASGFARGPFVKFNCAALPETIVESELFGHEKGSFTGATGLRKGRFELADGGTIFLDEVGELPLSIQAKLLRVLQEKTFERVGGSKPVKVDLRIIAATNRDLGAMVAEGKFREDLFYRLNVFPITIPPLRERGSDVITLSDHFVARFARETGKAVQRISTPALDMLMSYHWPGNVRELENVIERAVILTDDGVVHGYHLPPSLQSPAETGTATGSGLQAKLDAVEYEVIVDALKAHRGNMTEAARELNMTRRVLGLRMARFGLDYKTYRKG
jgi:Transcriptional regulator containing GAF, AAA-type ATPase, and DNA binding domains